MFVEVYSAILHSPAKHNTVTAIINCSERNDNCGSCGRLVGEEDGLQTGVRRNSEITGQCMVPPCRNPRKEATKVWSDDSIRKKKPEKEHNFWNLKSLLNIHIPSLSSPVLSPFQFTPAPILFLYESLLATLKSLHVHHILFLSLWFLPSLFSSVQLGCVTDTCFRTLQKQQELQLSWTTWYLSMNNRGIVAGSCNFNPFSERCNQKEMPQTWTVTISENLPLLQMENFCEAEDGSQQLLPSPHTVLIAVGSIATGQWSPLVSVFLSLLFTLFPLLKDCVLTTDSNFTGSEDSKQKVND